MYRPADDASDTDEQTHFALHQWSVGRYLSKVMQSLHVCECIQIDTQHITCHSEGKSMLNLFEDVYHAIDTSSSFWHNHLLL